MPSCRATFLPVRHLLASALIAWAALAMPSARADTQTLNFCLEDRDVRPWRTADQRGLNIVLLNRVAQRIGVRFTYDGLPWKRCLADLKANRVDGAIGASFSAARLEFGGYPGGDKLERGSRLNSDRYVVLRRKGSSVNWDGQHFSGLSGSIGIQLGYSIKEQLLAMQVSIDDGAPGPRELLRKLQAGHVPAAAMLEGEARQLLRDSAFREIEILPRPLIEKDYYLMLSHRLLESQPALASRLWAAIALEREGKAYRAEEARAWQ